METLALRGKRRTLSQANECLGGFYRIRKFKKQVCYSNVEKGNLPSCEKNNLNCLLAIVKWSLLYLDFGTSGGVLPCFFRSPFLFSYCLSFPRCAEFIPLRNHGRVVEARKKTRSQKKGYRGSNIFCQYFNCAFSTVALSNPLYSVVWFHLPEFGCYRCRHFH